jgi:hypothetical protein
MRAIALHRRISGVLLVAAGVVIPAAGYTQDGATEEISDSVGTTVSVESNLPADGFIPRNSTIDLRVTGTLAQGDRIAVLLGPTDVTPLFRPTRAGLRYAPRIVSLPSGERDMAVYLVRAGGEWQELRRFPLRVRNPIGFDRAQLSPRLDLGLEGQLAQGHDAATPPPERPTYQDFTGQLALESGVERGPVSWTTQGSIIGVSHQESALRFGELGGSAPRVDLSNYLARFTRGTSELAVGHVSLGDQRHLVSGFTSRGATIALKRSSRFDLQAGVMNGSSVVGWYNPFGLNNPDHRMVSGSLGLDALPRPGALRIEVTGLNGSVLPFSGYNQGAVTDAEESRGVGFRLMASDPSQRLRLESGYARSRFHNPADSTLAQGGELVPVREVTRNAHYVDATIDVVRDLQLVSRPTGLALGYRRERVDPLYRSLGAYAQPDREFNQFELRATVAGIALLGNHARSGDNLANLASVLTSLTRRTGVTADAPLSAVLGVTTSWLPLVSYAFDRTHQFGEGLPDNGEFAASHVPDQISRNSTLAVSWQLSRIALGYRWNSSFQDNRQAARENADFDALTNGVTLGINPANWLGLDFSYDTERAENREQEEVDNTRRYSGRANLRPFGQSTLTLAASHTRAADGTRTRRRRDTILDGHWSSVVPGLSRLGARYYLRFARSLGRANDPQFGLNQSTVRWSLNSGLNLGLTRFRR